jgi:FkbM family methyltransferase
VIAPLFDAQFVKTHRFHKTAFYKALKRDPIALADVGALWGPPPVFEALAPLFSVDGFEPSEPTLPGTLLQWNSYRLHAHALGAAHKDGSQIKVYRCDRPNNSSIYKPNRALIERYRLEGYEVVDTFEVALKALDEVVEPAEVIKLDVQGAEYDVLCGALSNLAFHTQCVVVEADFWPIYQGAPLFNKVFTLLQSYDFAFHDFRDLHHCEGRLTHADAIFFNTKRLDERAYRVQAAMALLLGFTGHYDHCIKRLDLAPEEAEATLGFARAAHCSDWLFA